VERAEAEAILDGDRETAVALLLRIGELVEANRRLEARVAELERRLSRSSRNSSLPPSQDPPSAPPRPRRPGSGRTRGGQFGHEGRHRPLLPLERVDQVVEHWPERCRACARVFAEWELVDAAQPWRHQVSELPPIAVWVTEHRLHRLRCPVCAAGTRAELPAAVPRSSFGPRLQAAVVTLAVRNRVSRRDTTELARELFGVELSTGSVDSIVQRTGGALTAPHTRLEREIKSAPVVNIDETGWKTAGGNRTLWGALSARTAVFRIAAGRHGFEARTLLGERFPGIVCSDRWRGYDYLDPSQRQLCWAHLLRDFTAHSEGMAEQRKFGDDGLRIARELFAAWEGYQADGDRARLQARIAPLQGKLRAYSSTPPARARGRSITASSPTASSSAGRRFGPSPTPTASSPPTTTPSAASAAPSSTASSPSAASPSTANARSSGCSPPRSPAASSAARSSPTSPTLSPRASEATPSPRSPNRGRA
jgi:transposase